MNKSVDRELLDLENDWAAAMLSNNAAGIGSFMADDWVIVSERGIANKRTFLAFVESGDLVHEVFDIIGEASVKAYDHAAIVIARIKSTSHYRGRRLEADEWTSDVFVKCQGRWSCVLSHITPAISRQD